MRFAMAGAAALVFLMAGQAFAATRPFVVTSFDSIRVNAPVRVIITTGGVSARGEGDRAALDRVDLTVSGGLLTIRLKAAQPGEKSAGLVTLTLSTGPLRRVVLTGGGSVAIDRMKGLRGDIILSGGGDVAVGAVTLDRLDVILTGGGRVTLAGTAGALNANISGAGALAAAGLKAKQVKLSGDGPGSATVTALTSADISTRGSGDMTVLATPACTVARAGTGRITCGGVEY